MKIDPKYLAMGAVGLGSIFIFNKSRGSSTPTKYVPVKQPSFQKQLDVISTHLEDKLNCPYLRDYLMTVAYVESRFVPSAIRYETGKGFHPDLFPANPWRNQRYLWEYTGGLFQLFPFNALNTNDKNAKELDPRLIFNPLYTIAFAIDFAYRLAKNYDAHRWLYVRFGWSSLSVLKNKPLEKTEAIQGRMMRAADELTINPQFLYQHPNFDVYSGMQFKGLMNYLLGKYTKK